MHTLLFCLFICLSRASTYDVNNLELAKDQVVNQLFENTGTFEERDATLCQKHLNLLNDPSQSTQGWAYRSMYNV